MSDLLPCPFCGGRAQRHDIEAREDVDNAGASYIECSRCGACTQLHFDRKEHLLDSWNSRSHCREECGRLHLRVQAVKDQRNLYQKRSQKAEEALKGVLSALVAITSIVIRAEDMKKQPSRAAASDTMFKMMLEDYDRATTKARAALLYCGAEDIPTDIEECGNQCATCEGSGEIFRGIGGPDDPERCYDCDGTGMRRNSPSHIHDVRRSDENAAQKP